MNLLVEHRFLILIFSSICTLITGCHPPPQNYLVQSQKNTLSWIGASASELIVVKGQPRSVTYLGADNRAEIHSEYWTQKLDRFEALNQHYGHIDVPLIDNNTTREINHYISKNTKGPWLYTYQKPVRNYRSHLRYCTEYYVIGIDAKVVESGFVATNINDHKHCPMPAARPTKIIAVNHLANTER